MFSQSCYEKMVTKVNSDLLFSMEKRDRWRCSMWYLYDIGQKTCIKLLEDGFVHTFEEIHNLMNTTYKKVKEEAELGTSKIMPKDFRTEPEILQHLEENLIKAEEAMRKGSFEDSYSFRMNLQRYFHEIEEYHWLAIHFYESSQLYSFRLSPDVKLAIESLQRQAVLEENRGNIDISLKYLKKAQKMAIKNFLNEDDPLLKCLSGYLCRVYQQLGSKYLERESDASTANKSAFLKYAKKAIELAMASNDLETQAACYALQGKAMMKFNEDKSALESFELYVELSEKNNDKYGMCQGFFAISEIFKRAGDFEKSTEALNKCQELAKNHSFDIPLIFSAISLGQIETAKRNYSQAKEHFEEAYNKSMISTVDYAKKGSLQKLAKVMYGIGNAHLTFHYLINNLQMPMNLLLPKLLKWRKTWGPFTEKVDEKSDNTIDLDEIEKDDQEAQLSKVIEKLINFEIDKA